MARMSKAAKKARAEYMGKWRKSNTEKTRAYNAAYWEKIAASYGGDVKQAKAAYMREWREKNRDKTRKYNAAYWEKKAAKEDQ